MKKVAFFIDNRSINDVDVSRIELGNPGIGGTEYLLFLIPTLLNRNDNGLDIRLYVLSEQNTAKDLNTIRVDSIENAIEEAEKDDVELFVTKHCVENIYNNSIHSAKGLKFIIWCHIFSCYWELDYYSRNASVAKVVFVSRETADLYIDHPIFAKSTYIFNCIDINGCYEAVKSKPLQSRKNIVSYVGSIVPFKGFHVLAEAWPEVIKAVPDAELYVIGSGKLYDKSAQLGKYGIAEKQYEDFFMQFLAPDGSIPDNIHFMGKVGAEKNEILLKTKVGVPNPSGVTETFCLGAIEFQIFGSVISTGKSPGYVDTVVNGKQCRGSKSLAKSIIKQLKTTGKDNYQRTYYYIKKNFSSEIIIKDWEYLLSKDICKSDGHHNLNYRLKWVKIPLGFLKKRIPVLSCIPPIERIILFFERKFLHRVTYMDSNCVPW